MAADPQVALPEYNVVYVDGAFVDAEDARLSVKANVVSYGTGTFEGLRATWNSDQAELHLLEPRAHYERLHLSARTLGLPLRPSAEQLTTVTIELLRRNEAQADVYIRPLLLLSGEALPVRLHEIEARLIIFAAPFPAGYVPVTGVRCLVSSWRRIPDQCLPLRAKVVGSYVNTALAKTEAVLAGFDEALMLTLDGTVAEATTSNVLIRRGGEWITPPVTDDILEGITRAQVMQLITDELGETVVERSLDRSELYLAEEALLCGTAVQVVPLIEVDHRVVGDGQAGERTRRLMELIGVIARGEHPAYREWTTPVYG